MSFTIDKPGEYLTRDGSVATVETVNSHRVFGTLGGGQEDWGRDGKFFTNSKVPSDLDIVAEYAPNRPAPEVDLTNPDKKRLFEMDDDTILAFLKALKSDAPLEAWGTANGGEWRPVVSRHMASLNTILRAKPDLTPVEIAAKEHGIGVTDRNGRMIKLGDRIVVHNESDRTKPEYWKPEYVVVYRAPTFTLEHVGGGKDGGSRVFLLTQGGGTRNVEVIS